MFEPIGGQVAKVVLDSPRVLAVVGQLVAAAMTQHVAMNEKTKPGRLARPRNHTLVARHAQRRAKAGFTITIVNRANCYVRTGLRLW
jgi:hypothetical protein